MITMTAFFLVSFISIAILFLIIAFSKLTHAKPVACKKAGKNNFPRRALATCKLQTSFSPLVQTDNHVVQKFDTRKIYKLSNEVIVFRPPFLSVSPFLLSNLARRQCDAYAIGLYTRPEQKADRMLNFVLMRSAFCRGVHDSSLGRHVNSARHAKS